MLKSGPVRLRKRTHASLLRFGNDFRRVKGMVEVMTNTARM